MDVKLFADEMQYVLRIGDGLAFQLRADVSGNVIDTAQMMIEEWKQAMSVRKGDHLVPIYIVTRVAEEQIGDYR